VNPNAVANHSPRSSRTSSLRGVHVPAPFASAKDSDGDSDVMASHAQGRTKYVLELERDAASGVHDARWVPEVAPAGRHLHASMGGRDDPLAIMDELCNGFLALPLRVPETGGMGARGGAAGDVVDTTASAVADAAGRSGSGLCSGSSSDGAPASTSTANDGSAPNLVAMRPRRTRNAMPHTVTIDGPVGANAGERYQDMTGMTDTHGGTVDIETMDALSEKVMYLFRSRWLPFAYTPLHTMSYAF